MQSVQVMTEYSKRHIRKNKSEKKIKPLLYKKRTIEKEITKK